jgi:AmmeMemoRadiSam system protein A
MGMKFTAAALVLVLALVMRPGAAGQVKKEKSMELSKDEKILLLKIARRSLETSVRKQAMEPFKDLPVKFKEDCGAFVTLTKNKELRGCIGYILPVAPLNETVVEMAKAAALNDTRFYPVEVSELKDIEVEISVLTPPADIPSVNDFIVGKHGIVINLRGRQAVFLPQVAVEQKWDRETTLKHLCLKAGLAPDSWKDPEMTFRVFEAIVFKESELLPH